jgi:hypothetical protein
MKKLSLVLAAAAALASPLAMAESEVTTAAATSTARARLDFQITIPRVLFLQVGTGSLGSNNTGIDLVAFAPNALQLLAPSGNIAASSGGTVTVRVAGNNGPITLTATAAGALNDGGTNTIPWTEIVVTGATVATPATGFTSPSAIAHPTLNAAGTTTTSVSLGAANTGTRREATWTYAYANSALYAPGTYGGAGPASPNNAGTNNGRLVYAVSMP